MAEIDLAGGKNSIGENPHQNSPFKMFIQPRFGAAPAACTVSTLLIL